jgi:MBG domain (YGX type)/Bacterial Ig-like domain (group 3)
MRYSALTRGRRHACRIDITVIRDAAGPGLVDTERVPRSRVARASLALALPVCLVVTLAGPAPSARAATDITVSTCDDSHLRAAVAQANSDNADDMILFACSGTISLTSTLDITGSMFINASGAQVTLDGGSAMGVLNVASGVTLKMTDLSVQNGFSPDGGALYNAGTANIYGGTFSGNSSSYYGGALENSSGATMSITGSTFAINRSASAEGGAVNNAGTMTITSSLFNYNCAGCPSGASYSGGAIANGGTMSISGSSFYQNRADMVSGGGGAIWASTSTSTSITNSSFMMNTAGAGGAIDSQHGTTNISFSTFWNDSANNGSGGELQIAGKVNILGSVLGGQGSNCGGGVPVDQGYNLESGTDCGFTHAGDLQNANAGINQEANFSLYLAQGSPAIDAVPAGLCPVTDQNGNGRPDDPAETSCDMGAAESAYPPPVMLSSSADPSAYGQPVTFTATVAPTDGGGTVAFYADGAAAPISGCGTQPLTQVSGSTYSAACTTTPVSAGTHAITASYSGDSSYPSTTGSLAGGQTVNPVPLTVTASSGSMTYGQAPPAITPLYSGFVNGDGPGSLHPAPVCSTNATASSPAGAYPSDCTGAADPSYVISYAGGTVTVTPAATALTYTGPQSVARGASFTPAATLSSPASACQAGQPVSFTLNANPKTGAPGTYPLESATTDGTGAATGASVPTSRWRAGAYTITASYPGTADCGASASTKPLVVTVSGLKAAGSGSYPVPGTGTVSVDFAVIGHTSTYHGGITLVRKGNWRLTGTDSGYTKSSATQGKVTGTGTLSWWNPALNNNHGGWQLASTGVAFTASFTATTTTSPGSFGIQISYTPVPPQPSTLPDSSPISLHDGIIVMA